MALNQNIENELPLWAQLRIDYGFADDDEKKKFETLAQETIINSRSGDTQCNEACKDICKNDCQFPCKSACKDAREND